jgi:hypothetical protein
MSGPSDEELIAIARQEADWCRENATTCRAHPMFADDAARLERDAVAFTAVADRLAALTAAGDDGEPMSPDWLRSIGFIDFHEETEHCDAFLSFWLERREHNAALLSVHWAKPSNPQGHFWSVNGFTCPKRAVPTTRGHVRRLLAALGVPLFSRCPPPVPAVGDDEKLIVELGEMFRWLMDWAETWHRDAGGYTASDTAVGLDRCRRLLKTLAARDTLGGHNG